MIWHTKKRTVPINDDPRVGDGSASAVRAVRRSAMTDYRNLIGAAGAVGDYDTVEALLLAAER